jgi:nucleoside-triphosphatase THEP1
LTNILSKINILSAPIHSGKSTALKHFILHNGNCCGILCPDIDHLRCLENIETGITIPFQKLQNDNEKDILVGHYIFSHKGFETARNILSLIPSNTNKCIIVDEIGKLELNGGGLEPAFGQLLQNIKDHQLNCILVVRDYLLEQAIKHYNIKQFNLLSIDDLYAN